MQSANVPDRYWELAMTYAAVTLSLNYSSAIGTSPYYYITGQQVNMKHVKPFWSKCYVFIPVQFRHGKLGCARAH